MSIIYGREKPVIKFINLPAVLHRIKIRRIDRLEFPELYLNIIGQSVVIVIYCLLIFDIHKGRGGCSSCKFRIGILIKLT